MTIQFFGKYDNRQLRGADGRVARVRSGQAGQRLIGKELIKYKYMEVDGVMGRWTPCEDGDFESAAVDEDEITDEQDDELFAGHNMMKAKVARKTNKVTGNLLSGDVQVAEQSGDGDKGRLY